MRIRPRGHSADLAERLELRGFSFLNLIFQLDMATDSKMLTRINRELREIHAVNAG